MESYKIVDDFKTDIKFGRFYNVVHTKHISSYGETGANNIVENIFDTYKNIQLQLENKTKNNNILLVGKVQSGKTSNLELFTALAFDNGYNVLVIYGGYDTDLLRQTTDRFKETFNIPSNGCGYTDKYPAIFSTDDSNALLDVDDGIIQNMLERGQPIIFVSMKRPVAMKKINKVLHTIDKTEIKTFIIDDEGDQASLNISSDKKSIEKASKTYKEITVLKDILNDPMYLSVTATPHANIFLDNWSRLRPDNIRLIQPGIGYDGVVNFNLEENDIIEIVPEEDIDEMDNDSIPTSLRNSVKYFIIASAIKKMQQANDKYEYSDMIIHSYREVNKHSHLYCAINSEIEMWKSFIDEKDEESIKILTQALKNIFDKYVSSFVKQRISFNDIIEEITKSNGGIIKNTSIILKDGKGKKTQVNEEYKFHKIYIGGDLMQRGLTFKNLLTTYFTRWPRDGGNMDTNMQRARWFGYREPYIDICKLFTTSAIAQEFSALGEVEEDLWEQFAEIENEQMKIDDILIQTENIRQRPTSRNKASFEIVSFKNRWVKQRYIILDKNQVYNNNANIDEILKQINFIQTNAGNLAGKKTGEYSKINSNLLLALVEQIQTVFDMEPFQKQAVSELIKDTDVIIIQMNSTNKNGLRIRTIYPNSNKIKALMQGADSKDKSKIVYEGDNFVIIDRNKINIQIHKIVPKIDGNEHPEFTQYMFAMYVPKEKTYYVKKQN